MDKNLIKEVNEVHIPNNLKDIYSIQGYTSVITGGASGLGEAVAVGFASFGSNIVLLDRDVVGMKRVQEKVRKYGVRCEAFEVDVTDITSVEKAAYEINKIFEKIDVLLNSAGMNIRKPAVELTSEEFQKVISVDLTGTFNTCKVFGKMMIGNRKGSIINFASINAHVALKGNIAYGCAKGGVVQMTKILAAEWADKGIRVNAISPAHHKTPLVTQLVSDENWYKSLVANIPMGRFAEAYEIIGPALFLASEASSFTTGISLLTDGGWVAM